jgi:hypothetical protein
MPPAPLHVRAVTFRGTQGGQKGERPNPAGPTNRHQQRQAHPTQAAGLLKAVFAGARRVAVNRTGGELAAAPAFEGLVQADDDRTRRHKGLHQELEQHARSRPRRPARPIEQSMVVLEPGLVAEPERTQRGDHRVVGRGQEDAAEQGLRTAPAGTSKQRGEGRKHGVNLGGWSKHKWGSLAGESHSLLPRPHFKIG